MVVYEIISDSQVEQIKAQQRQSNHIIRDETNRLKLKKDNMDTESDNVDRMILLNQSFRDRQFQYLVIMVLFLIVFGLCLAIVFCQERLGFSSVVLDVLLIIIIGAGFGTGLLMLSNINARDKNDFSKLGQDGGSFIKLNKKGDTKNALAKGEITQAMDTICKGQECCGPGFTWNSTDKKCAFPPP